MKLRIGICLRIMFAGGIAMAGLGLGGCSHSPDIETPEGSSVRAFTPQAPPFLAGPVAVLLTNTGGFSARLTIGNGGESAAEAPSGNEPPRPRTGQLLVAGTHL